MVNNKHTIYRIADRLYLWLGLSVIALAVYASVIPNSFVNDDFLVLKKVCLDKELNTKGFFRPLSDITLYGNYLISGFNPAGYRLTNVLLHAFNAFLLFQFCKRWRWTDNEFLLKQMAGFAALLFLFYPFHNESVVWILGRASLAAASFAYLGLVIMAGNWREHWKIIGTSICYFIALTGYESVFVLPAIILCWLMAHHASKRTILLCMGAMLLVVVVHFILRVQVAGSVTGQYGGSLISEKSGDALANLSKAAGRLFVPPVNDPQLFIALAAACYIVLIAAFALFWKKFSTDKKIRRYFLWMVLMLLIAMALPGVIGVSTNSSESDRFLYFPSFFLCAVIAFLLTGLLGNTRWWWQGVAAALLIYSFTFLQKNNNNWRKSSNAVKEILQIVKEKPSIGKLYIVNLPDEINGAFVFRVGFHEALLINRLDTSSIVLINPGIRRELEKLGNISHRPVDGGLFIPPGLLVQRRSDIALPDQNKYTVINVSENDRIAYWNNQRWVLVQ